MIGWRIARARHGAGLDGTGGLHTDGRWHSKGTHVCYAAGNVALAILEIRAHVKSVADLPADYHLYRLTFPTDAPLVRIEETKLPFDWKTNPAVTRAIGDGVYRAAGALVLDVPSVLVPIDRNLVIMGNHPTLLAIGLDDLGSIGLDGRLFMS